MYIIYVYAYFLYILCSRRRHISLEMACFVIYRSFPGPYRRDVSQADREVITHFCRKIGDEKTTPHPPPTHPTLGRGWEDRREGVRLQTPSEGPNGSREYQLETGNFAHRIFPRERFFKTVFIFSLFVL